MPLFIGTAASPSPADTAKRALGFLEGRADRTQKPPSVPRNRPPAVRREPKKSSAKEQGRTSAQ
jgi:hypothetical protein